MLGFCSVAPSEFFVPLEPDVLRFPTWPLRIRLEILLFDSPGSEGESSIKGVGRDGDPFCCSEAEGTEEGADGTVVCKGVLAMNSVEGSKGINLV